MQRPLEAEDNSDCFDLIEQRDTGRTTDRQSSSKRRPTFLLSCIARRATLSIDCDVRLSHVGIVSTVTVIVADLPHLPIAVIDIESRHRIETSTCAKAQIRVELESSAVLCAARCH